MKAILALVVVAGILVGCDLHPQPTTASLEQLIAIVQEPNSPDFWSATEELAKMGPAAAPAAKSLAKALQYPRRDSYMAGIALVAIGAAAEPAIPELLQALGNERTDVRVFAAFVLGTIGRASRCATPRVAELLWDSDASVRSTAAGALDLITGVDLVDWPDDLDPRDPGGVMEDQPESSISGRARIWWLEEGQYMDWVGGPNPCKPGE